MEVLKRDKEAFMYSTTYSTSGISRATMPSFLSIAITFVYTELTSVGREALLPLLQTLQSLVIQSAKKKRKQFHVVVVVANDSIIINI